ncbi:Transcriptional regulator, MerR family [Nitrospira defluvii]|uniref:Transcriptional regulator, MerR family n=2 Tax=Nitrospira defluvii TaxID=330214 RepID=A0ABM8QQ04_9BACT|nr:Transcriptional regulator, MerR family [Nitrospira defluvii]
MCQVFYLKIFDKHWTQNYTETKQMNTHRIHRVAKLTGLSRDVIRVWERRFDLLKPTRGANRYRNYSDEDVALLRYLKQQLDAGASIGDLAKVGREELIGRMRAAAPRTAVVDNTFDRLLRELLIALEPLDRVTFEKRLNGAVAVVPFEEALHGILLPLQERVGQLWHTGRISVAVEHYVTSQIKQKLYAAMNQLPVAEFGATVVVACPPGEEHDLAALAVAYRCRVRGCRVYYLGANVPILSLSNLCREVTPDLTIFSCTIALPDSLAIELIKSLAQEVLPLSNVLAGGQGALTMRRHFSGFNIDVLETFGELDEKLEQFTRRFPIPG